MEFVADRHLRLRTWDLVFRAVPPFVLGRSRAQCLRVAGFAIGRGTAFWGFPTIVGAGNFEKRLVIGRHCGFNVGCFFDLQGTITFGDNVAAGHRVMFLSQNSTKGASNGISGHGDISIGEGVWLGARATVCPGVTIGAGSVVAAGVVVKQNLPENTLFTGSHRISLARWR